MTLSSLGKFNREALRTTQFVIGNIEPEDEELALSSYLTFCKQRIQQQLNDARTRNYKISEPIPSTEFCSHYEKMYDYESKNKNPHIFT